MVNGVKTEYEVKNNDHDFGDWKLYNPDAKDCENKLYFRTCSDCNSIEWRDGKYEDHKFNTVTTKPTCQAGGYDTKTCTLCGKVEVCNEKPKTGHDYGMQYLSDSNYHWKECKTCGEDGTKTAHIIENGICMVCDPSAQPTEGVMYDISEDGTYAEVIAYEGSSGRVKIAEEYKGLPVKNIYDNAFNNNTTITEVIIPDSVITIGSYAFMGCSYLNSVVIGDGVITIGSYAFWACDCLASVVIGESVTTIDRGAFYHCPTLAFIVIPDSVTTIGELAFSGCSSLNYNEYGNCKYLGNENNPYLALIETTSDNYSSFEIHPDTKIIAGYAFYGCSRLTSIVIPDSVTTIGDWAFSNCSSLTSVVIPDSVTTIGWDAFSGCSSLKDVYYTGSEEEWQKITIGSNNNYLTGAEIHFNYAP